MSNTNKQNFTQPDKQLRRYDVEFLLQFQTRCNATPPDIPPMLKRKDVIRPPQVDPYETLRRTAQSIMNKLTPNNFTTLSLKLTDLIKNDRSMINQHCYKIIVDILFEKAVFEPNYSDMYCELCNTLIFELPSTQNSDGKPQLTFRGELLKKCQKEFEEKKKYVNYDTTEEVTLEMKYELEEKKTKLAIRTLGTSKLIGSLFKKGLISERIVHFSLAALLNSSDESDMCCFVSLLTSVGQMLDHAKGKQLMDTYFLHIHNRSKDKSISTRVRFMLQDLIELREGDWKSRHLRNVPKTLPNEIQQEAQLKQHEQIQRERLGKPQSRPGQRQTTKGQNLHSSRGQYRNIG